MPEIVYLLTNEFMPGLVKIGRTGDSVESRISTLSANSGVPAPFECYFAAEVNNAADLESKLHLLFKEHRVNERREFFKVSPEKIVLAISIGTYKEITPGKADIEDEGRIALERVRANRSPLRLNAIGINKGDVLSFSRDESITVTVGDGGKVILDGELLSLSPAALKVLNSKGYKSTSVNGALYWVYDGELLSDRRDRLEAEQYEETKEDEI
ncbi:MAG TPA: GIY-YIG nuclease family protein [Candidatus Deferrimicrobiaceae bacterium]|jgi:hypothetical protein